jgi:hypothetical protein
MNLHLFYLYHKIRSSYNTIFLLVAFFTTLFSLKSGEKGVEKKATSKKIVLYA